MQFHGIFFDLFDLTSFIFAWTFLNYLAHYELLAINFVKTHGSEGPRPEPASPRPPLFSRVPDLGFSGN